MRRAIALGRCRINGLDGLLTNGELGKMIVLRGTPKSWECVDCGVNTAPGLSTKSELKRVFKADPYASVRQRIDHKSEVYSVRDVIWKKAAMGLYAGCLCIGCLEARIGRKLKPKDFELGHAFNDPAMPATLRLKERRKQTTRRRSHTFVVSEARCRRPPLRLRLPDGRSVILNVAPA